MKGNRMNSRGLLAVLPVFGFRLCVCLLGGLAVACASTEDGEEDLELSLDQEDEVEGAKGTKVLAAQSKDAELADLPQRYDLASLQRFLKESTTAAGGERAMRKEYQAYFQVLSSASSAEAPETAPLVQRLQEDPQKAHWAFIYGVYELTDLLQQSAVTMLHEDRERNFVSRMRTLVFLARELDKQESEGGYTAAARKVYSDLSQRYFDRKLEERKLDGRKPEEPKLKQSQASGAPAAR